MKELVSANERHPESGRAVSLGRKGNERLHSADPRRSVDIVHKTVLITPRNCPLNLLSKSTPRSVDHP